MRIIHRVEPIIENEKGWDEYFEISSNGVPCSHKVVIYVNEDDPRFNFNGPAVDWIREQFPDSDWTMRKFFRENTIFVYYFNNPKNAVLFAMSFKNIYDRYDRYDSIYGNRDTLRKTYEFIKSVMMNFVYEEERKQYKYSAFEPEYPKSYSYSKNSPIDQTKNAISVLDEVFSRYDYMDNQIKMMYTEKTRARRAIDQIIGASNNIVSVSWNQDIQDWLDANYPDKHTVVKLDTSPAVFVFEDSTAAALFKTFWG